MSRRSIQKPSQKSPRRRSDPKLSASSSTSSGASRGSLAPERDVTVPSSPRSKSPPMERATRRSHSKSKSRRKGSPMKSCSSSSSGSPLVRTPPKPKPTTHGSPSGSRSPLPQSPTEMGPPKADSPTKRPRSRPESPTTRQDSPKPPVVQVSPKSDSPTKRSRSRSSAESAETPQSPLRWVSPRTDFPTKRSVPCALKVTPESLRTRTSSGTAVEDPETPQSPPRWVSPETDLPTKRSSVRTLKVTPESLRTSPRTRSPKKKTSPSKFLTEKKFSPPKSPTEKKSSPQKSPTEKKSPAEERATLKSPPKRKPSKSPKRPTTLDISQAKPGPPKPGRYPDTPCPDSRRLKVAGSGAQGFRLPSTSRAARKKSYVFLPHTEGLDREHLNVMMSQLYGCVKSASGPPPRAEPQKEGDEDPEGSYDLTVDRIPLPPVGEEPAGLENIVSGVSNLGYVSSPSSKDPPMSTSRTTSSSSTSTSPGSTSKETESSQPAEVSAAAAGPSRQGSGSKRSPTLVQKRAVDIDADMEMYEWMGPFPVQDPRAAPPAPARRFFPSLSTEEPSASAPRDAPVVPAKRALPTEASASDAPAEPITLQAPPASDARPTPASPRGPSAATGTSASSEATGVPVAADAPPASGASLASDAAPKKPIVSPRKRRHSKEKDPLAKSVEPPLKPARKKSFDGSLRAALAIAALPAPTGAQDPPSQPSTSEPQPGTSGYREVRPSVDSEEDLVVLSSSSRAASTETPPPTTPFGSAHPSLAINPTPVPGYCHWRRCYQEFLKHFNRRTGTVQDFFQQLSSRFVEQLRRPEQSASRRFFLITGLTVWLLIREASQDYWFLCSNIFGRDKRSGVPLLLSPDQAIENQMLGAPAVKPKKIIKRGKAARKAFKRAKYQKAPPPKSRVSEKEREETLRRLLHQIFELDDPIPPVEPRRDFTASDCPFVTLSFEGEAAPEPIYVEWIDQSKLYPSWKPKTDSEKALHELTKTDPEEALPKPTETKRKKGRSSPSFADEIEEFSG